MSPPLYTTEVLRLAASLPDPEPLAEFDAAAEERSLTCGSRVVTAVTVDGEGRIAALSQQVQACAFGQASAALVGRHAAGRTRVQMAQALDEVTAWLEDPERNLPDWPGIAVLAPVRSRRPRHAAVLLPFRALLAAMKEAEA